MFLKWSITIGQNIEKARNRNVFNGFGLGAPAGTRTPDTLLKRQVLYRLSYWGAVVRMTRDGYSDVAGMAGLEPTISESKSGVLPLHYIPMAV